MTASWVLMILFVVLAVGDFFLLRRNPGVWLLLDDEGFAMWGTRADWQPEKVKWCEVECFSTMELPRMRFGRPWKVVTVKFQPGVGVQKFGKMLTACNNFFGADAFIPMTWPRPHEMIAEELNQYRSLALRSRSQAPPTV